MSSTWNLQKSGQFVGQFSTQQLRELALAGRLKKADVVRKGESGKPNLAGKVKNLFAEDKSKDRPKQPPPALPKSLSSAEQTPKTTTSPLQATSQSKATEPPPLPPSVPTDQPGLLAVISSAPGFGRTGDLGLYRGWRNKAKRFKNQKVTRRKEAGIDAERLNAIAPDEYPFPRWNSYAIACNHDQITVQLNGRIVNHLTGAKETEGLICFVARGLKVEYRKIELGLFD